MDIPSFEERKVDGGKNNVVFYKLVIGFQKNNKKWFLLKRYSEFDTLDKFLKDIFPSMPSLPGKTIFKLSDSKQIENRRVVLTQYMKTLINRRDMRTCPTFRKFIELENNFPYSQTYQPHKVA